MYVCMYVCNVCTYVCNVWYVCMYVCMYVGEGDTIGCGLIYASASELNDATKSSSSSSSSSHHPPAPAPPHHTHTRGGLGQIFFTKNGQPLGIAFERVSYRTALYPVIGLDSYHTVSVNFGNISRNGRVSEAPAGSFRPHRPFAFDLLAYQRELLGQQVGR